MINPYIILLSLSFLAELMTRAQSEEITSMPGWTGALPSKMYSGYLNGSATTRLYYVYVEAEVNASTAPITLWMNGGPGCSSLLGFYTENGPFEINNDMTLRLRPYRWTRLSNMLYIENPVGTGFSYSTINNYNSNDQTTAAENLGALQHFFQLYPHLKNNRFSITGESYAGVYIPSLSNLILDAQKAGSWKGPNLQAIAVGNGCTGNSTGSCSAGSDCDPIYYFAKFFQGLSFWPPQLKETMQKNCNWTKCEAGHSSTPWGYDSRNYSLTPTCMTAINQGANLLQYLNVYNVMSNCPVDNWCKNNYKKSEHRFTSATGDIKGFSVNGEESYTSRMGEQLDAVRRLSEGRRYLKDNTDDDSFSKGTGYWGPTGACGQPNPTQYMNQPAVMKAMHAKDPGFCWGGCNDHPKFKYTSTIRNLPKDTYPRLFGNLRVFIYNGDVDSCVPYTDNEGWVFKMGYPTLKPWKPWSYTNYGAESTEKDVGGYITSFDVSALKNDAGQANKGSFHFMTVRDAGHMVPQYQPAKALEMFRRFLNLAPMALPPLNGPEKKLLTQNDLPSAGIGLGILGASVSLASAWIFGPALLNATKTEL